MFRHYSNFLVFVRNWIRCRYSNLIEMALKHRDNISMPQTQFLYIFAHLLNMHFGVFYSGLKWNRDFNVTNLM